MIHKTICITIVFLLFSIVPTQARPHTQNTGIPSSTQHDFCVYLQELIALAHEQIAELLEAYQDAYTDYLNCLYDESCSEEHLARLQSRLDAIWEQIEFWTNYLEQLQQALAISCGHDTPAG